MDRIEANASAFDRPTEAMDDALPLLYQSGYLTIKDYDKETDFYVFAIPNNEVRTGFVENMIPSYTGIKQFDTSGFAMRFWRALKRNNINSAMSELKTFLAGIPTLKVSRRNWRASQTMNASMNIRSGSSSTC